MSEQKILINKVIGGIEDGITADFVSAELAKWDGVSGICIEVNSAGGSVWECVGIFNTIRDFVRKNPHCRVNTYIKGMAASSASLIAIAAKCENRDNKITCEDNSVYMMHNASAFAWGDKRELQKECDLLAQIDEMMARTYSRQCGKDERKCAKMMDDETWLFGQQIVDQGFADEVLSSGESGQDQAAAIVNARAAVMSAKKVLTEVAEAASFERIAAQVSAESVAAKKIEMGKSTETGVTMTVEEIKAQFPNAYAEIFEAGKAEGAKDERARCDAHLKMGEVAGCLDVSAAFIRDGSAVASNDVQTKYFEKRCAAAQINARLADDPAGVSTPKDEADKKSVMMAAFDKNFR